MNVFKIPSGPDKGGLFIRVTREEAIRLIASLALQHETNDANAERIEMRDDKGRYFSLAVMPTLKT